MVALPEGALWYDREQGDHQEHQTWHGGLTTGDPRHKAHRGPGTHARARLPLWRPHQGMLFFPRSQRAGCRPNYRSGPASLSPHPPCRAPPPSLPPSSNARTSSSAAAAYTRHLSTSVSAPPCRASVRRHRRSLFAIRLIARAANPSWLSCRPRACYPATTVVRTTV